MNTLRLGIAGLGTVGQGVTKILTQQADLLTKRSGKSLQLHAVSARDKKKKRSIDLKGVTWYDDPNKLATDPDIDIVLELIGGADGAAYTLVETALKHGKHVVTANKALIAQHGTEFAALAEEQNVALCYEAAVAGGIPVIKTLREGLSGNNINQIEGILNGTCNYILTAMEHTEREFSEVLSEAQELGYAEADPTFDVDGIDAAHKLAILASLAYGAPVRFDALYVEGIRNITLLDIAFASELGYRVKLLGVCCRTPDGIEQRVHPCLLPFYHPLAIIDGVDNAVQIEGDAVGSILCRGPGAGEMATASAVIADVMDIACGRITPPFGIPLEALDDIPILPIDAHEGPYYLRLEVDDKPGVLADVSGIFRDCDISLASCIQHPHVADDAAHLILVTHTAKEKDMQTAIANVGRLKCVQGKVQMIRICE